MFGNKPNEPRFNSEINYEKTEIGECFLLFGADSFVFHVSIKNIKIKIQRTIILPVVLYGCETCSLTLREERRLRIFENRVLYLVLREKR